MDDCAGSWVENVPPNLATSLSPETLAGGPCSRDVIMNFGFVNMILSLARDLKEDLFMGPICHNDTNLLFGACGHILLVTTTEVSLFLVTSAADANGCNPCSGNSEPVLRLWLESFFEPESGRASPTASPL
uniref:Uncharacterized protein n=1 Tax=Populus alba TaxID=43335 RepID=A0A4U5PWJ6_POPAL|nr:hypothetical protein D5086_0000171780 [Populus alba]